MHWASGLLAFTWAKVAGGVKLTDQHFPSASMTNQSRRGRGSGVQTGAGGDVAGRSLGEVSCPKLLSLLRFAVFR